MLSANAGFFKFGPKALRTANTRVYAESPSSCAGTFVGTCRIGAFSYAGADTEIYNADIGRYCSIAPGVTIGPTEHTTDRLSTHLFAFGSMGPFGSCEEFSNIKNIHKNDKIPGSTRTTIGNDVWIGRNCIIRRGVNVGDGAIIGAGSVVVKDVPAFHIVGGVPARVIRPRFSEDEISRLTEFQWWNYDLAHKVLQSMDLSDINRVLDTMEKLRERKKLNKLKPVKSIFKST